jgi:hypothetical protein
MALEDVNYVAGLGKRFFCRTKSEKISHHLHFAQVFLGELTCGTTTLKDSEFVHVNFQDENTYLSSISSTSICSLFARFCSWFWYVLVLKQTLHAKPGSILVPRARTPLLPP